MGIFDMFSNASKYEDYTNSARKAGAQLEKKDRARLYENALRGIEMELYGGDMNNEDNANVIHSLKLMGADEQEIASILKNRAQSKQVQMFR